MPYSLKHNFPALLVAVMVTLHSNATADSLIAPGAELETISTEFQLADGPAWDGSSLWFPDVKGGKLYRYSPKSGKLTVAVDAIGRISASFYNHGKLYLSDNGASSIAWLQGNQKITIGEPRTWSNAKH
jgi:sugar lactone lactonase YvrE